MSLWMVGRVPKKPSGEWGRWDGSCGRRCLVLCCTNWRTRRGGSAHSILKRLRDHLLSWGLKKLSYLDMRPPAWEDSGFLACHHAHFTKLKKKTSCVWVQILLITSNKRLGWMPLPRLLINKVVCPMGMSRRVRRLCDAVF